MNLNMNNNEQKQVRFQEHVQVKIISPIAEHRIDYTGTSFLSNRLKCTEYYLDNDKEYLKQAANEAYDIRSDSSSSSSSSSSRDRNKSYNSTNGREKQQKLCTQQQHRRLRHRMSNNLFADIPPEVFRLDQDLGGNQATDPTTSTTHDPSQDPITQAHSITQASYLTMPNLDQDQDRRWDSCSPNSPNSQTKKKTKSKKKGMNISPSSITKLSGNLLKLLLEETSSLSASTSISTSTPQIRSSSLSAEENNKNGVSCVHGDEGESKKKNYHPPSMPSRKISIESISPSCSTCTTNTTMNATDGDSNCNNNNTNNQSFPVIDVKTTNHTSHSLSEEDSTIDINFNDNYDDDDNDNNKKNRPPSIPSRRRSLDSVITVLPTVTEESSQFLSSMSASWPSLSPSRKKNVLRAIHSSIEAVTPASTLSEVTNSSGTSWSCDNNDKNGPPLIPFRSKSDESLLLEPEPGSCDDSNFFPNQSFPMIAMSSLLSEEKNRPPSIPSRKKSDDSLTNTSLIQEPPTMLEESSSSSLAQSASASASASNKIKNQSSQTLVLPQLIL